MNARVLWSAMGWTAAALLAACGADVGVQASAGTTGAGGSSGSGTSATGFVGASTSVSTGPGGMDASADAPDATFMPGFFDCMGCLCDGKTHYCYIVQVGSPPARPPEPPCDEDGGATGCVPLPPQCAAMPSCSCFNPLMGFCTCTEMGGGVTVGCGLP